MPADTAPLLLYNSLTQAKEPFVPGDPARVTLYVCGPTVYNFAHIGNARPAVVFDVLFRALRRRYGSDHVVYARNITDIDDKIITAAEGGPIDPVVERFTAAYHEDMGALGTLAPTIEPCATLTIEGIVALIERLVASGHAYAAEGHVLFHVPSYESYGRLSRRSRAEMVDGARVEVAPYKRDPADFVLWKPSTAEQPGWDSPWGRGRPGWHIECSAMIAVHLGATIDIHGGGQDLKFPHHENEIAQSACAHGAPLARLWMHNGFVNIDAEKMSKSLGNVLLVRDLLARAPGEAIRYALLAAHYRKPLDWSDAGLDAARAVLDKLYRALGEVPAAELDAIPAEPAPAVVAALEDDLNTPLAFAELHALAGAVNTASAPAAKREAAAVLRASGALLGLLGQDPVAWAHGGPTALPVAEIERLIAERAAARRVRDFATADRIRDELARHAIVIEDRAGETTWRQAG